MFPLYIIQWFKQVHIKFIRTPFLSPYWPCWAGRSDVEVSVDGCYGDCGCGDKTERTWGTQTQLAVWCRRYIGQREMFSDNLTEILKANNLLECCSLPGDIYFHAKCYSSNPHLKQNQINSFFHYKTISILNMVFTKHRGFKVGVPWRSEQ